MKLKIAFAILLLSSLFLTRPAQATEYAVSGTTIQIYGLAENWSNVYALTTSTALSGSCGNALYIRFADKALYATALTAAYAGKLVTIKYTNAAATGYAYGLMNSGCQVISITW